MFRGESKGRGRLFTLATNGITIFGFALTTVSGLMIITFLIVNLLGGLHENPYIGMYLVDNSSGVGNNQITPPAMTPFNVYACFDRFGTGGGMLGCSFAFTRTFGGFKLSFQNLLGGLLIGDPEVPPGCALTSGANPVYPTGGIIVAAVAQYMYAGSPAGFIQLGGHGTDGRAVADANNLLDFWCIRAIPTSGNFGVCVAPPAGDCPVSPVEESSWGSIKALYR